jgi:hypothetical protein
MTFAFEQLGEFVPELDARGRAEQAFEEFERIARDAHRALGAALNDYRCKRDAYARLDAAAARVDGILMPLERARDALHSFLRGQMDKSEQNRLARIAKRRALIEPEGPAP